jgi:hypothetical protein
VHHPQTENACIVIDIFSTFYYSLYTGNTNAFEYLQIMNKNKIKRSDVLTRVTQILDKTQVASALASTMERGRALVYLESARFG